MSLETARDRGALGPRLATARPVWLRLALRDLATAWASFPIFMACIALGVMVITAVGALSDALRSGLATQGAELIGGDMTLARTHVRATAPERERLSQLGRLSETATLRTMARREDGKEQALAELKAVDTAYPLTGAVKLGAAVTLDAALADKGAVVDPLLLQRLDLKVGDTLKVGDVAVTVRATLANEPDNVGDRSTFGPRVMISASTLHDTGLVQPGTLIRWRYAIAATDGAAADEAALKAKIAAVTRDLPEAGFTVTNRFDPSPQLTRTLERLRQFFTLLGLTSLMVGGVGMANAVATFIERRRKVIATMKSVGASNGVVLRMFLTEILVVAAAGIAVGLGLGLAIPQVLAGALGDALPVKPEFALSWRSVGTAVLYGALVTLLFALYPLSRAADIAPATLFREDAAEPLARARLSSVLPVAAVAAVLLAVTVISSDQRGVTLAFCAALAVMFAVFYGVGTLIPRVAARLPRTKNPAWLIATRSLAGRQSLARAVILSLGLGLSLLVAVALVDASLVNELKTRLPGQAPAYFVLDISKQDVAAFETEVKRAIPAATVETAPMLRGRLVRLKDQPIEDLKVPVEAQWVLTGDRGLTFSASVPEGSRVVAGQWWPADYAGEPLVSFETELARKLGLALGDTVTVNVLGRNITARIASLRDVKWDNLSLNFVMVFTPSALSAAPYKVLATIHVPRDTTADAEVKLARELGRTFPAVTPVRVKDAIDAFEKVFGKIVTAVRVAGSITLVSGALVLAGALATAQRRRILDAVIFKALGATRARILAAHAWEYGLLALVAAGFAVALGTIAAWVTVTSVMSAAFVFSPVAVLQALTVAFALIAVFGGIGTFAVLRAPAVPYLKSE